MATTARRSCRIFAALCTSAPFMLPAAAAALSPAQQEFAQVRQSKPNLDRGAELFRICAGCHGPAGGGTAQGMVPRIAGQHASVLEKQLVDYRYDRRWDLRMEQIANRHHLPDAQAIACRTELRIPAAPELRCRGWAPAEFLAGARPSARAARPRGYPGGGRLRFAPERERQRSAGRAAPVVRGSPPPPLVSTAMRFMRHSKSSARRRAPSRARARAG